MPYRLCLQLTVICCWPIIYLAMRTKIKTSSTQLNLRGFTIVELLIVIVVIAILAAITIVAFNGVQSRARDAQRMADIKTIVKALELYKSTTGTYPNAVSTANASGWEVSTTGSSPTNFLAALVSSSSGVSKIPVDPTNTGDPTSLNPSWNTNEYEYYYYFYPAGQNSCDTARGAFYVLGVTRMETVAGGTSAPTSPNWSCGNRNWQGTGAWVTGSYVN